MSTEEPREFWKVRHHLYFDTRYAMCGFRSPVHDADGSLTDAELLARAAARPPYRRDWQSRP